MAAGIPGAGIGGLFYLASTFLLPFRSLWRRLRGRPDTITARELGWHLAMAGGIVGGIWVAGWLLVLALPGGLASRNAAAAAGGAALLGGSVIRVAAIAAGFFTLGVVLAGVEVARLLQRGRLTTLAAPSPGAPGSE